MTLNMKQIKESIMMLSNSELRDLSVFIEREIVLSEMCIEEGTEKRR